MKTDQTLTAAEVEARTNIRLAYAPATKTEPAKGEVTIERHKTP